MRHFDWQLRLADFVAQRQAMPFCWGSNDCCQFAIGAVHAITGVDHGADIPPYSTALGAARTLEDFGGLMAIASNALGAPVPVICATVGDVVLVHNAGRDLLAICNADTALAPGESGIIVLSITAATAAWKV